MKFRRWFTLALCLALILASFWIPREVIFAQGWEDSYEYYLVNGTNNTFVQTSAGDGDIYLPTYTSTKYTATNFALVGWRFQIYDAGSNLLQEIYMVRDGGMLEFVHSVLHTPYRYGLYRVKLSDLISCMNEDSLAAYEEKSCFFIVDACLVVTKSGKELGSLNADGSMTGRVYMDNEGICNAAAYSTYMKATFPGYFNRSLDGIFLSGGRAPYPVEEVVIRSQEDVYGRLRFISKDYVVGAAGLSENSIWLKDPDYRSLLVEAGLLEP